MVIKKLIAISVVFALVAGTAFAVDLAGQVFGVTNVVNKPAVGDASLFTGGISRVRLEGSGEAEIGVGSVGGWLRAEAGDVQAIGRIAWSTTATPPGNGVPAAGDPALEGKTHYLFGAHGLAWWQPIEALRIQLGVNPDGHYDASHIGRHGFYQQANEMGLVTSDGNWGPVSWDNAVFGGVDYAHFALIVTPMEALSVNVVLPLNQGGKAADTFKAINFQVNYTAGFGAIHVTYAGAGSPRGGDGAAGAFYASTNLTLVENLGIEVGFKFGTAPTGGKADVGFGLAASYNAGSFGIKLRSIFTKSFETGSDLGIRVDLLPSFAVNDSVTIFMDAGILLGAKDNFIWHVAPYVRIGNGYGPAFYAGLRASNAAAYSTAKYASGIALTIPIGFTTSF